MTFHGIVKAKSRNLPFEVTRPKASLEDHVGKYEQKRKRSRFPDDVKTASEFLIWSAQQSSEIYKQRQQSMNRKKENMQPIKS